MIVVKIELHSAATGKMTELGRMYIRNDGSLGNGAKGNYDGKVCRKGSFDYPGWDEIKKTREGRVENYPRWSYNIWRLISRMLKSAFPEEA